MKLRILLMQYKLGAILIIFIIRLFCLQIWNVEKYRILSKNNTHLNIRKAAVRAPIVDRNGVVIARTVPIFKLTYTGNTKELRYFKEILNEHGFVKNIQIRNYELSINNLSIEQAKEIFLISDLPVPQSESEQRRTYVSQANSHLIGYVQKVDGKDVGITGIEKVYNSELEGVDGMETYTVNSKQKKIQKNDYLEPQKAPPLQITIDAEIQEFAYEILSQFTKGAVIVLDVETGEVLCAVSYPSFDANDFCAMNNEKIKEYYVNPLQPLFNLFLNGIFPTGSVIKPFMLLCALEKNLPKVFYCNGKYQYGNRAFHCMHEHGAIPLEEILSRSCNIAFYTLSEYLNRQDVERIWSEFGLGEPALPELSKNCAKLMKKENWTRIDTLFMQIGQVASITTLAQIARAYARLATGKKVELTLTKRKTPVLFADINFKSENFAFIRKAMYDTINTRGRTAFVGATIDAAGKTGTAQVKALQAHEYRKSNMIREWHERDHAWFCAFGPASKPKIVVCMIIFHGGRSYTAVQPTLQIMDKVLQKLYGIRMITPIPQPVTKAEPESTVSVETADANVVQ